MEKQLVNLAIELGRRVPVMMLLQITILIIIPIQEKMKIGDLPETTEARVQLILAVNCIGYLGNRTGD